MKAINMSDYKFADLFAGCGGFSLGFLLAGMKGRFAVERDQMAFETFYENLIINPQNKFSSFDWPIWLEKKAWDIDYLLKTHKSKLKTLANTIDVLIGGPPCQGFSPAGKRKGNDPRNFLFQHYVEVVRAIQPKIIVLENVPGMRTAHKLHKSKAGNKSFYEKLADLLEDIGYQVKGEVIDAARFGVPQKRERLIAIGVRNDLIDAESNGANRVFSLIEKNRIRHLKTLNLKNTISVSEAISDLRLYRRKPEIFDLSREVKYKGPITQYQKLMHAKLGSNMDSMKVIQHRDYMIERYSTILSECTSGVKINSKIRKKLGITKRRVIPLAGDMPSFTLTTLPDDLIHYCEPRILTVREYARLQSFPDWFFFKGKYTTGGISRRYECPRYTQIGNAVPPYLAKVIATAIIEYLDETNKSKQRILNSYSRRRITAFV